MCGLKQKGGIVAWKDRDQSFLMSSFVHTRVYCKLRLECSDVQGGRGEKKKKKAIVVKNIIFLDSQIASVLALASHPQLASRCMINAGSDECLPPTGEQLIPRSAASLCRRKETEPPPERSLAVRKTADAETVNKRNNPIIKSFFFWAP